MHEMKHTPGIGRKKRMSQLWPTVFDLPFLSKQMR